MQSLMTRLLLGGGGGFSPSALFASGEQGAWYDPSDLTTLFQDSAGTTPVTAVEQPVGRILDKSGRGNHAFQSTSASRPTLRARYNLLTYSEQINGGVGTWFNNNSPTVTTNNPDPNGTNTASKIVVNGTTVNQGVYVNATAIPAGQSGLFSVWLRGELGGEIVQIGDAGSRQNVTLTTSWQRFSNPSHVLTSTFHVIYAKDNTAMTYYAWGAQLVPTAVFPSNTYQQITTATSYATGAAFPPYLFFDGVDDSLLTNSVDFSATDKMTVWAGVTKSSDAATGVLAELSASFLANNGSFIALAPDLTGASGNYSFGSRGSLPYASNQVASSATVLAPVSSVLSSANDIAGDLTTLRVNGVAQSSATGDKGTGNFGNYPLYIGRRNNATLPLNGNIYSLIIRGAATASPQLISTEQWVAQKSGITIP